MILRGDILDGKTVHITVVNNKVYVKLNHDVECEGDEDLDDMDLDIDELE
jgi:hypothetical protein